eukprot:7020600-Prorocentrum_lima.AAC.1
MTSSLVGSEMCIRDRLLVQTVRVHVLSLHTRALQHIGLVHSCRKSGAVSYTHLTLPTICSV